MKKCRPPMDLALTNRSPTTSNEQVPLSKQKYLQFSNGLKHKLESYPDYKKLEIILYVYKRLYARFKQLHGKHAKIIEKQYMLEIANNRLCDELSAKPDHGSKEGSDSYTTLDSLTADTLSNGDFVKRERYRRKVGNPRVSSGKNVGPYTIHHEPTKHLIVQKYLRSDFVGKKFSSDQLIHKSIEQIKQINANEESKWKEELASLKMEIERKRNRSMRLEKQIARSRSNLKQHVGAHKQIQNEYAEYFPEALKNAGDFIGKNECKIRFLKRKIDHLKSKTYANVAAQTDFGRYEDILNGDLNATLQEIDYTKQKLGLMEDLRVSLQTQHELFEERARDYNIDLDENSVQEELAVLIKSFSSQKQEDDIKQLKKRCEDIVDEFASALNYIRVYCSDKSDGSMHCR